MKEFKKIKNFIFDWVIKFSKYSLSVLFESKISLINKAFSPKKILDVKEKFSLGSPLIYFNGECINEFEVGDIKILSLI